MRLVRIIYRPEALDDIEAIEEFLYNSFQSNTIPRRVLHRLFRRIE